MNIHFAHANEFTHINKIVKKTQFTLPAIAQFKKRL